MVTSMNQKLWALSRMIQQIPISSGNLPKSTNLDTKYSIALVEYEFAEKLGFGNSVSLWDILEKIAELSDKNPPERR